MLAFIVRHSRCSLWWYHPLACSSCAAYSSASSLGMLLWRSSEAFKFKPHVVRSIPKAKEVKSGLFILMTFNKPRKPNSSMTGSDDGGFRSLSPCGPAADVYPMRSWDWLWSCWYCWMSWSYGHTPDSMEPFHPRASCAFCSRTTLEGFMICKSFYGRYTWNSRTLHHMDVHESHSDLKHSFPAIYEITLLAFLPFGLIGGTKLPRMSQRGKSYDFAPKSLLVKLLSLCGETETLGVLAEAPSLPCIHFQFFNL